MHAAAILIESATLSLFSLFQYLSSDPYLERGGGSLKIRNERLVSLDLLSSSTDRRVLASVTVRAGSGTSTKVFNLELLPSSSPSCPLCIFSKASRQFGLLSSRFSHVYLHLSIDQLASDLQPSLLTRR